jgi:SepF-like predicted cell division protein (DUF552 family)
VEANIMEKLFDKIKEFLSSKKGSFREELPMDLPELQLAGDPDHNRATMTVHSLEELKDTYNILNEYRGDKIVLIKLGKDMRKNTFAMKKAIDSFKLTCGTRNGRVAGLDDRWLILLPNGISIEN